MQNAPASDPRPVTLSKITHCLAIAAAVVLAACQPDAPPTPEVRPVRTITVVKRDVGETVTYTGRIQAENETRQSFRIAGRMIERSVNVGDRVMPGQVVAKLEPQDELNALRSAAGRTVGSQAHSSFRPRATSIDSGRCWRVTSRPGRSSSKPNKRWKPHVRRSIPPKPS